jgi:hypothetical protein
MSLMTPSTIGLLAVIVTWLCSCKGHIIFSIVFYNYNYEGHVFYDYDVCNYNHENMASRLFSLLAKAR